ncbi:hypothetical protein Hamer_G031983 [Homarus americanus]|uniref:Uncharacterized protein n=1 Tax=Homarus americanus TaxID=6706 RepID=A0A8J5MXH2_HOMAM|nr:hypothetical protein Hamer_G031983 [Homarus americanus]
MDLAKMDTNCREAVPQKERLAVCRRQTGQDFSRRNPRLVGGCRPPAAVSLTGRVNSYIKIHLRNVDGV